MARNEKREIPIIPELTPPIWMEPWVEEALLLLQQTIAEETSTERLERRGLRWDISVDELYVHCVIVASRAWDDRLKANPGSDRYTRARFLTACGLFESEAKYRIESLLQRNSFS